MRRPRLVCRSAGAIAAAVAALWCAGPATAAGPWSPPQTVPGGYLARWDTPTGGALHIYPGIAGFTAGGVGFAVLGDAAGGRGLTTFDAAAGAFRPLRASTFGGVRPALGAPFGRSGLLLAGGADAVGDRRSPLNADILLDAAVTRGTIDAGFQRRQILARGVITTYRGTVRDIQPADVTAFAANAAGDAAAVVAVPLPGRLHIAGFRSRLLIRRHGQPSFRKVMDFGKRTTGRSPAALAVNGTGDVLVAWDDRASVRARLVRSSGRVGAEQRLGRGGSAWVGASRMVASMDSTRRMLVAWLAQRVGEGNFAGSPGIVAYAYASPSKKFGAAHVVQTGLPKGFDRGIGAPGVQATLLRTDAVVAWTGYTAGRFAVRAVDVRRGRPSAPVDPSPPGSDAFLESMAVGPRGGLAVAWSSHAPAGAVPDPSPGVYVRARAAGAAAWGPLEALVAIGAGNDVVGGVPLAVDPVTGRTVALWSDPLVAPPVAALTTHSSVRASPDAG